MVATRHVIIDLGIKGGIGRKVVRTMGQYWSVVDGGGAGWKATQIESFADLGD
jgi:hypothetical protein